MPQTSKLSPSAVAAFREADEALTALIAHCETPVVVGGAWQKEYDRLSALRDAGGARLLGILRAEIRRSSHGKG